MDPPYYIAIQVSSVPDYLSLLMTRSEGNLEDKVYRTYISAVFWGLWQHQYRMDKKSGPQQVAL